jgi:predicted transcriptional regulator
MPRTTMPEQTALHQDTHLQVLRLLQANPRMNQRELAQALGVSLGKTNFCLKALLLKAEIESLRQEAADNGAEVRGHP